MPILSDKNIEFLLEIIKKYCDKTDFSRLKRNWKELSDQELWYRIIEEILVMGGSKSMDNLQKSNEMYKEFQEKLSIREFSKKKLSNNDIKNILQDYHVGRFPDQQSNSILKNYSNLIQGDNCIIRKMLNNQPTTRTYEDEIRLRNELMSLIGYYTKRNGKFNWYQFRRKPISNYLTDIGFSKYLMSFDSRIQKLFKITLGIRITPEKYEKIEGEILNKICDPTKILPAQLDRILYQNYNEIIGPYI